MKFKISTLIDITETGEHRGSNLKRTSQQANYNTVIQTLGLRANVIPGKVNKVIKNINQMGFGKEYHGVQKVWELMIDVEFGEHSIDFMCDDFYLVPIITGLDETVQLNTNIFNTDEHSHCNIVFERVKDESINYK